MVHLHDHPHHDGSELYAFTAGTGIGAEHAVRVRVPLGFTEVRSLAVRILADGEPRFFPLQEIASPEASGPADQWWEGRFALPNPVTRYRFLLNLANGAARWLSADGLDRLEPRDSSDFRVTTFAPPPTWATAQVMYQIFPDRFGRSDDADDGRGPDLPDWAQPADWADDVIARGAGTSEQLFGGDLDGITQRLDHLERIGVTLIYLTPFFPARSNHRYDASSFDRVDPILGGDEALVRLTEAAHARGMRVIGDLTTNHTGDGHEWFVAAHGNPGRVEGGFYYWTNRDHTTYEGWYGVPSLPKLNWNSEELRRRFIEGSESVVAKWLQPPYNLDGWRIDVANMTGRLGADDLNRDVQRMVRQTMDQIAPEHLLYAESTNDASVDFDGEGWHAPMSYSAFTRPVWHWLRRTPGEPTLDFGLPYGSVPRYSAEDVVATYRRFTAPYPWAVRQVSMNAIDTHDTARFAEHADDDAQLVAAGLSMALPGTPVIFAGDEFALRGENGEGSRTPLPWAEEPRLADAYGRLTRTRRESHALQRGSLRWLLADEECMVFLRELPETASLVFAARGARTVRLPGARIPGAPATFGAHAALTFGDLTVHREAGDLVIECSGPAFGIWSTPDLADLPRSRERTDLAAIDA